MVVNSKKVSGVLVGGSVKDVKKPQFGVRYYADDAGLGFGGSMVCPCGCDEYGIKFHVEGAAQGLYAECLGCRNLFKLANRDLKGEVER